MHDHNLFRVLAAVILVGAVMIASVTDVLRSLPFFLFALAMVLRASSLQRGTTEIRNAAYLFFLLGFVALIWTFV